MASSRNVPGLQDHEDSGRLVATKTEQVKCCQTLVCLLQALTGSRTVIELRNEITIKGLISSVDVHMNTVVLDAVFRRLNGEETRFEQLFIHGNQIRYVQIPEGMDVMEAIQSKVDQLHHSNDPKNKTFSKRRKMRSSRMTRQREERSAARAFKLGRGRGLEQ